MCDGYYALDSLLSTDSVESESDRSIKLKYAPGGFIPSVFPPLLFFCMHAILNGEDYCL